MLHKLFIIIRETRRKLFFAFGEKLLLFVAQFVRHRLVSEYLFSHKQGIHKIFVYNPSHSDGVKPVLCRRQQIFLRRIFSGFKHPTQMGTTPWTMARFPRKTGKPGRLVADPLVVYVGDALGLLEQDNLKTDSVRIDQLLNEHLRLVEQRLVGRGFGEWADFALD